MRVCPRRHYHTKDLGWDEWCIDCGAVYSPVTDKWHYPAITELVRGRGSDRLVSSGVYRKELKGGDPTSTITQPKQEVGNHST